MKYNTSKFGLSRNIIDGPIMSMAQVWEWIAKQRDKQKLHVKIIPLTEMKGWEVDSVLGNITHESGRFFSITGCTWNKESMPIMLQPEIGILGILAATYKGIFHILVQAKVEPGNVDGIQISPTVQATRSNYLRVHGGHIPDYLSPFIENNLHVIIDQFQSEQSRRYLKKRNRNVILEVDSMFEAKDGFLWITLGQLYIIYKSNYLVNSCLRSIIATIPWAGQSESRWTDADLIARLRNRIECSPSAANLIPLNEVKNWSFHDGKYTKCDGSGIEVLGAYVEAGTREVSSWTQPIIHESRDGVYGLVVTNYNNIPHIAIRLSSGPGCLDYAEWTTTWIERDGTEGSSPVFWKELFENCSNSKIVYDQNYSEEGGRFYRSSFQHLVYYISGLDGHLPENCELVSLEQISRFMMYTQIISMELRSIISCCDPEWFHD